MMAESKKFEEMMQELEAISKKLETGDLSLDESVSEFEKGMKLSKECSTILENAEKKITVLMQQGEEITEETFETE